MGDTVYKVKDPTGAIREIRGPEGASDDEIIAQAQKLFSAPATPPTSPISAAITGAVKAPFLPMKLGGIGSDIYHQGSDVVGSAVTEGASRMGLPSEAAAGLGTAAYVGAQALPAVAGSVGQIAPTGLRAIPRGLMQSSIKPNLEARQSGDAGRAINTMLEKGINATPAAMETAKLKVGSLENTLQEVLRESTKRGLVIDGEAVAKSLDTLRKDTALRPGKPENLKQIQDLQDRFTKGIDEIVDLHRIPIDLANKIKQTYTKDLTERVNAYQPGQALNYFDKAQKQVSGEIRRLVGEAEPKVVPTLKEQSELLNVLEVAGPQISREGNKNIVGLGWLSPSMLRTAGWMLDRYPWFKSMLARGLYAPEASQAGVGIGIAAGEALSQQFNKK